MTGKRIIILSSLFHPVIAANSKRMTHLALSLKEQGADVTVITARPYYPTSGNNDKKDLISNDENYKGIRIIRSYIFTSKYKNILKRLISFLTFMASSVIVSFKIRGKVDAVVTISPPFTSLFSGYIISKFKRSSFFIDIQDLYPQTLVDLGYLKSKLLIRVLEFIEKFFYKKAAGIAIISNGFKDNIIKKRIEPEKIEIIANWVDTELFDPAKNKDNKLLKKYNLDKKFIILFAGTMGFAQGLEVIIESANILKKYQDKIEFVFIGEGVEKEKLKSLADSFNLKNITFIPSVSNEKMPAFLSIANAYLVHLRKNELYKITIPSKIYEYLAMAKPVIIGVKGDALDLINKAKAGIGFEPESAEELSGVVLKLYNDSSLCKLLGKNGRHYAEKYFSKSIILDQYVTFISELQKTTS